MTNSGRRASKTASATATSKLSMSILKSRGSGGTPTASSMPAMSPGLRNVVRFDTLAAAQGIASSASTARPRAPGLRIAADVGSKKDVRAARTLKCAPKLTT